ncbi:unnamed protein product, partial [Mesorhabditis belari]|uniref:Cell cycle control protein 50A n=1 Tax=Mesorhabditis belari TaxID=2138241 RepID=A0AAF3FFD5_9BILA
MAGNEVRNRGNVNASPSAAPATTAEPDEKVLKNRPKASALRQQRLPAWQPILTATTVIPAVFCVGIVFIPIGVALYLASSGVEEFRVDYSQKCTIGQPCTVPITIEKDMEGKVFFYYFLSNYYQNHRRYVKSRNDQQYMGNYDSTTDCEPFDKMSMPDGTEKKILPCGAIANSMFNDNVAGIPANTNVTMTTDGVIWEVDEQRKFKNPSSDWKDGDCTPFQNYTKPPNWPVPICQMHGGMQNVDFIVWMRTAALPSFRKLHRILQPDGLGHFTNGLPKGSYRLQVQNNYPVSTFGGTKEFVISTTSWAGGKNGFLGVAYMAVGSLAILLGIIFIIIHIKFGHSVDELSNINRQS